MTTQPKLEPQWQNKFYLRRVYLNQGGYDRYGTYWGNGLPLYSYLCEYDMDNGYETGDTIRAMDREHAKSIIRKQWPNATFYR